MKDLALADRARAADHRLAMEMSEDPATKLKR
jgi:hypothetical protein